MTRVRSYLSLGSNLGDRVSTLADAIERIAALPGTSVVPGSSIYETEPAYHDDQPPFANMVIEIETDLDPGELYAHTAMIESDLGRIREFPNAPRTLDIDILLYGDEVSSSVFGTLEIPHPRMRERAFVMVPLLEIAPRISAPDGLPYDVLEARVGACTGIVSAREDVPVSCYTARPS